MVERDGFLAEARRGGWRILLAALLGVMLGITALPFYTLGVFSQPIAADFGWTRAEVQSGFAFQMMGTVLVAWAAGWMTDRFGARPVALVSQLGLAAAFLLFAIQPGDLVTWRISWLLLAVLAIGTSPLTWSRGIMDWFDKGRGMALGIALSGSGITAALAPPVLNAIIASHGWREGYLFLGGLIVGVGVPLTWLLFRGRSRTAARAVTSHAAPGVASGVGFAQALAGYRFWLLLIAVGATHFTISGIIPNVGPILEKIGVREVAWYSSLLGVSVMVGRIVTGALIDRFWAPAVAAILLMLPGLACLLLWQGQAPALAAVMIGLAAGAEFDLIAFLCARYFGMRSYGRIYAWLWAGFAIATGAGAYVFASLVEASGGHAPALLIGAAVIFAGASSLLLLGRYPDFAVTDAPRP